MSARWSCTTLTSALGEEGEAGLEIDTWVGEEGGRERRGERKERRRYGEKKRRHKEIEMERGKKWKDKEEDGHKDRKRRRQVVEQSRAPAALPEDLGSIPSTHTVVHKHP